MSGMELLIVFALVGLALTSGVLLLRRDSHRTWQQELVTYVLTFPRGLDVQAVIAFLEGLSGIVARRYERPFVVRAVVFETSATAAGIVHRLVVPRSLAHVVMSALRAALPSVSARPDDGYQMQRPVMAAELGISDHGRTLATNHAGVISNAILAALQPLATDEQVVVQWSLSPFGPVSLALAQPSQSLAQGLWNILSGQTPNRTVDSEALKAAQIKRQTPLFAGALRVGVVADRRRARSLLMRVLAALHTANAPGVHLRRLGWSSSRVGKVLVEHRLPLVEWPCTVNAAELCGLLGFPLADVSLPGLRLGGTRQLAPASDIPRTGRIVAEATFPGAERPLALSVADSLRHLHVIGPTGAGKSSLLCGLIAQDMAAGHGVLVVEPSGDLVNDVLDRVPAHRLDDVVILDPADEARPVGLNVLAGAETAPELVVDQVVGIFHDLYRSSWGPRTDDILRAAVLTLVGVPGMTLTEVPLLLTDASFRRTLVGRVDDPIALGPFWAAYEAMSNAERAQAIGPVMNKLRAFLLRRRLRNVIGQADAKLNLDQALAEQRIILAPLNKGLLGEEAAALIGALLVARTWQAVQRRSAAAPSLRPTTFAYIDEFQNYLRLPTSIADVLAEARKLKFGLTLAHQHLGQLPSEMQKAVLANARSRIIFQTSAGDAGLLARELAPHLTAQDLQGLSAYEVAATLSAGARIAPPVTGHTLLPPPPAGLTDEAKARSRERYGRERAEVEQAIRARHDGRPAATGAGRRGRQR
jgi:hypothetical protein